MSNINVNNLTPLLGSGSSVSVSGSLVVKNDVTIGGHLYIGDANTDSVTFSAEVSSSILPDANITYDLGSASKQWREVFLNSLVVKHITASGNISASGTGTNGTGSFHHLYSKGNIHATGTGSFDQAVIASNSSSFTYVSMSGALDTSYHVSASRILIHGGNNATGSVGTAPSLEVRATASIGYISASGDMTMSGTASFGGGVDALNASGSFLYVHVQENLSGSASGSFNDLFVNDNVEIQGVTNLHGNISSSNSVTASFGYLSSSGDLNVVGQISSSRVSASNGFEADLTSTSSFGHVSMSSVHTLPTLTSSFGHVTMSGDLGVGTTTSPLGHVHIKDGNSNGETPSLNANDLIIEGNGNTGLTIMTNTTSQGAIYFGDDSKNDGRIIYQHGVAPRMSIYTQAHEFRLSGSGASFSGDVSSSGRVSASSGFEADGGTTSNFGAISMSGNLTLAGQISSSRVSASAGFEADTLSSSSFGYVSTSGTVNALGNVSSSANVYGTQFFVGSGGAMAVLSGDGAANTVKMGGASSVTQIHGISIDVTGSISMSGEISMSAANSITIDAGNLSVNTGDGIFGAAVSASETVTANSLAIHNAGVSNATISADGTGSFRGGIDCIGGGSGFNATGSFGYISCSQDVSSSGTVFGETLIVGTGNSIVNGNIKFNGGIVRPLKNITADTVLDATSGVFADAGKTIVLNAAAGCDITLPPAEGTGNVYKFFVGTAITSNQYRIKVQNSNDTFVGAVHMVDADDDSQTTITAKGTDDTISLNGGTTGGGLLGDCITFTDIKSQLFVVEGNLVVPAGSNPADPFSANV